MAGRTASENANGIFEPFSADEVPVEVFSHGRFGSSYRHLGRFGGGSHVGVVLEELQPGLQSNQMHYHLLEEEHVFILEGSLTLLLGERRYVMKTGDHICFPAGQKAGHALFNHTDAPCRYLLVGENNAADVVVYTETGRVGVRLTGEGYRKSATMEYWDDVEQHQSADND